MWYLSHPGFTDASCPWRLFLKGRMGPLLPVAHGTADWRWKHFVYLLPAWTFLSRSYKESLQSLLLWSVSPAPQLSLPKTTSATGFSASSRLRQIQDMVSLLPFLQCMIKHGTHHHEWLCPPLCLRTTPACRVPHSSLSLFFNTLFPIFCCAGSWLLHSGFLQLPPAGLLFSWQCAGFSLRWLLLLQSSSSAIVMHGLSRSEAYGILPDQGLNLCALHWQVDFYPLCQLHYRKEVPLSFL